MADTYLVLATMFLLFCFIIYLAIDFMRTPGGLNPFFNKWTKKSLWIWLPFYALQRLIREVILKK